MSFQGDVRGIGLAELLQGLARGRKEGTLTLTAKTGQRSTLGMEGGQVFLLPDPDEEAEVWRDRVRDAWADDPDFRVDYLRMSEIARAQRLEDLYALLDGEGVHFRFEPGTLAPRRLEDGGGNSRTEVHCQGVAVEFLLLEYARISDHVQMTAGTLDVPRESIPCVLDSTASDTGTQRFFAECNGSSTLAEMSDRLGWPLRQTQVTFLECLNRGVLRVAGAQEMLNFGLIELARKNFSRAAGRLSAWCRDGRPGPVTATEAEALSNEWLVGRLQNALRGMKPRRVRTLLRRLDHALGNPSSAALHWNEAQRNARTDLLTRLHHLICEFRDGNDPERPGVRELIDVARELRDSGHPARGGPALTVAAMCQPTGRGEQLEIGQGLVAAGRVQEGGPWILSAARDLLKAGNSDRAVVPLRQLLQQDPRNRECRQLLSRARRSSTHVKRLRHKLLIGLAITLVLSGGAMIKVRADQHHHDRIDEVRALLHTPFEAMVRLQANFPTDESPELLALREEIRQKQLEQEMERRSEWIDAYRAVRFECAQGDPGLALEKILALPDPPDLRLETDPWPEIKDLFDALAERMGGELVALGPPLEGAQQQIRQEEQLRSHVDKIRDRLSQVKMSVEIAQFLDALDELEQRVRARGEKREALVAERLRGENLRHQDMLLAQARAHTKNGDFARSLHYYEELLKTDVDGKTGEVLAPEIEAVRGKQEAVDFARKLASAGEHDEAYRVLSASLANPELFLLPWVVESFPPGAHVRLGDGSFRQTPFDIETTFGEEVTMVLSLDGFDNVKVRSDRPADKFIYLSRTMDRGWRGDGRIDAAPVSVGDDHVVVDRKGRIARIGQGGAIRWEKRIQTLSGIARAPVFLPRRPGHMLLVTEDGAAWIIEAETGNLEGPWEIGGAPIFGPAQDVGHVRVRLQDGRIATWRDRLKPTIEPGDGPTDADEARHRHGSNSGLEVLRRRASSETSLACPWNDWRIDVEDVAFFVYRGDDRESGYSVARDGEWEFVAWEAPFARAPHGRLWIADASGVRAFVPLDE